MPGTRAGLGVEDGSSERVIRALARAAKITRGRARPHHRPRPCCKSAALEAPPPLRTMAAATDAVQCPSASQMIERARTSVHAVYAVDHPGTRLFTTVCTSRIPRTKSAWHCFLEPRLPSPLTKPTHMSSTLTDRLNTSATTLRLGLTCLGTGSGSDACVDPAWAEPGAPLFALSANTRMCPRGIPLSGRAWRTTTTRHLRQAWRKCPCLSARGRRCPPARHRQ